MAAPIEQLANRTVRNIRFSTALSNEAASIRQTAVELRREATVLCRFSALERRRRAILASRQPKQSVLSYLVL